MPRIRTTHTFSLLPVPLSTIESIRSSLFKQLDSLPPSEVYSYIDVDEVEDHGEHKGHRVFVLTGCQIGFVSDEPEPEQQDEPEPTRQN